MSAFLPPFGAIRAALRGLFLTAGFSLLLPLLGPQPSVAQEDVPVVVRELLEEAERYREAGRTVEAVGAYERALELGPGTVAAYISLGSLHHAGGDRERALEVFLAGLEVNPEDPDLLFNATVTTLELDRLEAALELARRGSDEAPKDSRFDLLAGSILRRLGRSDEAVVALERARKQRSKDPRILYALGNAYHEAGRLEDSIRAYRDAIDRDGQHLRARYNLGTVLFEVGRYDQALEEYQLALAPIEEAFRKGQDVDPIHARAFRNLGAIHSQNENWEAARQAYAKALRLAPEDALTHYDLAYAQLSLGDPRAAEDSFEKALALDAEAVPLAHLHLARITGRDGRYAEQRDHASAGASALDGQERVEALALQGEALSHLGDPEGAMAAYHHALTLDPDRIEALIGLGLELRRADQIEGALAPLERARSLAPEHPVVALELAALARARGDRDRERELYDEILGRHDLWQVRLNLALLMLREGQNKSAARELERIDPTLGDPPREPNAALTPDVRRTVETIYGLLLVRTGDTRAATRLFDELAKDDEAVEARRAAAVLKALQGDLATAAPALEATLDEGSGLARGNLGQVLWLLDRSALARPHLEAAVAAAPENPDFRLALGEIAWRDDGDLDTALEHLSTAAELCRAQTDDPTRAHLKGDTYQIVLGQSGSSSDASCLTIRRALSRARTTHAFQLFREAPREAAQEADRVLRSGLLDGEARPLALLIRGAAGVVAGGSSETLRADLRGALDAGLPSPELITLAWTNLGVAQLRAGDREAAAESLERALRTTTSPPTEILWALAVALDDPAGDTARAHELFLQVASSASPRADEARSRAEALRSFIR